MAVKVEIEFKIQPPEIAPKSSRICCSIKVGDKVYYGAGRIRSAALMYASIEWRINEERETENDG